MVYSARIRMNHQQGCTPYITIRILGGGTHAFVALARARAHARKSFPKITTIYHFGAFLARIRLIHNLLAGVIDA